MAMTRLAKATRALSFDFFFPLAKSKATALPPNSDSEILEEKLQELQDVRYIANMYCGIHSQSLTI